MISAVGAKRAVICILGLMLVVFLSSSATAQSISFIYFDSEVGSGLQSGTIYARLSDSQHGGVTVRIETSDTTLSLVSPGETTAGARYVDVYVPNGSINAIFVVQGLEDTTGTVTITATAPGFAEVNQACDIVQPGVQVWNLAASNDVFDPVDEFLVQVGIVGGGGAYLVSTNKVRSGGPGLTATITNTNATAAELVTTPATGQVVTAEIAAGEKQTPSTVSGGGVGFDGLAAGTTDVTATIPGFITTDTATMTVTVEAPKITITSLPGEIGAGLQTGAVSATLSGGAHGGVMVHIESGDSSLALVADAYTNGGHGSLDIFAADGQIGVPFYVQGLEDTTGIVVISVSAPGFAPDAEAAEIVTPAYQIHGLPTSIDVFDAEDVFVVRVGIPATDLSLVYQTQRARAGGPGITATVVSSESTVGQLVTLTDTSHTVTVTISPVEYQTAGTVSTGGIAFDGIGLGTTTVSASIPNFLPTTAAYVDVEVTQPELIYQVPAEVGAGLRSGSSRVQLGASQHGGVTVHVEVDDTDIGLVSVHGDSVGEASVDIPMANGQYLAYFYIHGIEDTTGTVMLTTTAPGFTPETTTVDIVTPGICLYSSSLRTTIDTLDPPDPFQVSVGVPAGGNATVSAMEVRPGSPGVTVTATNSNAAIGILQTLTDSSGTVTTSVAAGESRSPTTVANGGVEFNGLSPGVTTVSVSAAGFLPMTSAAQNVTVTAPTISWIGLPGDVGSGLQTASLRAVLSVSNHGGVTVRIESTDPDIVLVSAAEEDTGEVYVDVEVLDGSTLVNFYAHGIDDTTGSVTIMATVPGFESSSEIIDVVQPALDIRDIGASVDVSDPPDAITINVGLGDAAFTRVNTLQKRRVGAPPLVATVVSSVSGTAEVVTLSDTSGTVAVDIYGGNSGSPATVAEGGVAIRGLAVGQTIVSATIPGFVLTGDGTRVVDVTNQSITYLGAPSAVGAGLQSGVVTARLGVSDHGGVTIHIESSDAGILLVASGAATPGTAVIDVPVTAGQTDATFYIHGIDDTTGTVTLTASVPTFNDGVMAMDIVAPAIQITSLPDSVDIVEGDVEFIVQVGIPENDLSGLAQLQSVRAGGVAKVAQIASSDDAIAGFVTTLETDDTVSVTIPVGTYQSAGTVTSGGVAFDPIANGVAIVTASASGIVETDAANKTVHVVGDLTGIGDGTPALALTLGQNVPNPFNPVTTIGFTVGQPDIVTLIVYDVSGRKVRTLVDRIMAPGMYSESWNGRDTHGDAVASGVYFYRLHAGSETLTKKMVFLK